MLVNLALGTVMVALTVLGHTVGLLVLTRSMGGIIHRLGLHADDFGRTVAMVLTVLGLFLLHTFEVWAWAVAYVMLGAIGVFHDALYFSTVTFSTLGYGDIILSHDWRLFASLEGVNGFILIGWSTAYLVAAATRFGPFRAGKHF